MTVARPGDFWSGLVLAALGTYVVAEARGWSYAGPDGPGPGFFPLWYGIAMMTLSLMLVVRSAWAAPLAGVIAWHEVRRALTAWAAFMISVALLKVVGFMVCFALLTWFIVAMMFRRSHLLAFALAIVGALAFQGVFALALGISLPLGFGR